MNRCALTLWLAATAVLLGTAPGRPAGQAPARGVLLETLTWPEAETRLTAEAVVVLPLGAAAKEHGPHLKLSNDFIMAEYLKRRIVAAAAVVVAPTLNYGYYPAFVEYPGSTTLRLETARDVVVDICRSLARFGPKRFYVLNTGISTLRALKLAAEVLAAEGLLLRYTDLRVMEPLEKQLAREEGGTHADEIETSMILYIAPDTVDMTKAVKDYHPSRGEGGLTRDPAASRGVYSPTGTWGDPTLAAREKGKKLVEALVARILHDIADLEGSRLPQTPKPGGGEALN
jgi:creatinine amidohydrolase